MKHAVILGWLIYGITALALPGWGADRERQSRSVLAGIGELDARVTYTETKIPLGELIQKVSEDTGVALIASRDVADEPVAVVVKDFPARELLEEIADLLDYRWGRRDSLTPGSRSKDSSSEAPQSQNNDTRKRITPKGATAYEIWQDLAGKQREEALRRALEARAEQRLQEELEFCRQLTSLSQKEAERLRADWEQRQQQLQKLRQDERGALRDTLAERQRERLLNLSGQAWSPIWRSLAGLVSRLSPEQWAAIRSKQQIIFSSAPRSGEFPLPADVLRVFRSSQPAEIPPGSTFLADNPELEREVREREREQRERWTAADAFHVTVRMTTNYPSGGWIVFNAISFPVRDGQRLGAAGDNPVFVLNIQPEDVQSFETDNPERRRRLQQDALLGAKKVFHSRTPPLVDSHHGGSARSFRVLQDVLPDLARAYSVNFITDSYWSADRIDDAMPGAEPRPLFEILDRFTRGSYTWDRRGTLVRLRNTRWFLERPREIPLRYVRRWVALTETSGALPLEELESIVTTLTDAQLDSLPGRFALNVFPKQLQDLSAAANARHIMRLYHSLLPDQQRALMRGDALPFAQIPTALRPLILATLNRLNRRAYPLLYLEWWATGRLSLTAVPETRVREERGDADSRRTEPLWRSAAVAPASPRLGTPPPAPPPSRVHRYSVTRLRFQMSFGAAESASVELVVAGTTVTP